MPNLLTTFASPQRWPEFEQDKVICIGASTGGIEALSKVLADFPAHTPPVVIVQHTKSDRVSRLAHMLDGVTEMTVKVAGDLEPLRVGHAYLAPDNSCHLELARRTPLRLRLVDRPPISRHRPSVDALFRSAVPHGRHTVGVILTGMGCDGALGMLEMYQSGATTFAQDEETSLVYGMPGTALRVGGVTRQVPLQKIAGETLKACLPSKLRRRAEP
ncbi:CheB methylesterase domain-containing protein [Litoreibacter roseus]|uniref:protein-glutamate methylesterase n=1 Tax=Litoreibacter roseus TaxID=2601869 RepID=A0A6N6JJW3_9RHOB|nr:CheB methylesterase domain-containing protein [Litoreibacter roseus]GFE66237.1 hypothetical protein KIN_33110 [Litoreibacter roseus]